MKRLLLLGESWTTHMVHQKGFDSFTTTEYVEGAGPFTAALSGRGWDVDHLPAHEIERRFPTDVESLGRYDCVVISDVGANTFQLSRRVFAASAPDVDRLGLLVKYVRRGGGLLMVGGYLSFSGIDAKARYGSTALAELLPVCCLDRDDRCELPSGLPPAPLRDHPALAVAEGPWPSVLGYNQTTLHPDATLLATIGNDPLIAVREIGKGRSAVFTSDMSAHWAPTAFTEWPGYAPMWDALASWVAGVVPGSAQADPDSQ